MCYVERSVSAMRYVQGMNVLCIFIKVLITKELFQAK